MAALTLRALRAPFLGAILGLAAACASPVTTESTPAAGRSIERIALAPLELAPRVERPGARIEDIEPEAAEVIASRLVEALALQGEISCVAPSEVSLWLERSGAGPEPRDRTRIAAELSRAFGVDAVLFGQVRRYSSRVGGPRGAVHPAAVWFDLELLLPDGTRIWQGSYREEQKALSDDLFSLPRAARRGFAWLDAPGLATEGARELVEQLASDRRRWR